MVSIVPDPPDPFNADTDDIPEGTTFYRIGSTVRPIDSFNPGHGSPTRFAFFGTPPVPVLYAAATEEAAVAETLLHDIPATGGILTADRYTGVVMGRLTAARPIRLAKLRGTGLRRLRVEAMQITDTNADEYDRTVLWAQAAHAAGFDGLAWTSRLCNDTRAIMLFGDRAADAVRQDVTFGRYFTSGPGLDWLIDMCAPLHVDVLPPT